MSCKHETFSRELHRVFCSECRSDVQTCADDLRARLAAAERERDALVKLLADYRRDLPAAESKLAVAEEALRKRS